jgi:hypothetical protein
MTSNAFITGCIWIAYGLTGALIPLVAAIAMTLYTIKNVK